MKKKIFIIALAFSFLLLAHGTNWKVFFQKTPFADAAAFETNTSWVSTSSGNWNYPTTWGTDAYATALSAPTYSVTDSLGEMFVYDWENGSRPQNYRMIVLNADGTASTTYNYVGNTIGGSSAVRGLTYSQTTGDFYFLTDAGITVLNSNMTASTTYVHDFSNPYSLYNSSFFRTSNGTFYVAHPISKRIEVINPDGTASSTQYSSLCTVNSTGTSTPVAVAVAPNGQIYSLEVCGSQGENRLRIYNPDGSVAGTYNESGEVWGYSTIPDGLSLGPDGKVYILSMNTSVTVLNSDFTLNTVNSQMSCGSLSIDSSGKFYCPTSGAIKVFSSNGTLSNTYNGLILPSSYVPVAGVDYPSVNDSVVISKGTVTLTENEQVANLQLLSGATLNLNGYTLTVGLGGSLVNNGGTLTTGGGSIKYLGTFSTATSGPWNVAATWGGTSTNPLPDIDYPGIHSTVILGTATVTLTEMENVRNITLAPGGVLNLAANTLNVAGAWSNTGGALKLNPGNEGTVNFISNSTQSISGNTTFENLTKSVSSFVSLLFDVNSVTTITHNLFLTGPASGGLSIAASGYQPPSFSKVLANQSSGASLAHDNQGDIYAYDLSGNVSKYDSNGNLLLQFSTGEGDAGVYNGIAIDSNNNIWVTQNNLYFIGNSYASKLQEYSATGTLLGTFGNGVGTGDGQFNGWMWGLGIDPVSGNIVVPDSNGNRIEVFDSHGNYLFQFGSYGQGNGQVWGPTGIAFDASDNMYVADNGNGRIEVFDSSGNYLWQFGTSGAGTGQLNSPWHIAIDSAGYIYVADRQNNRVEIFNPDGSYKSQFGSLGTGNGQFNHGSMGITIDNAGNIYVTNWYDGRIQEFASPKVPPFSILQQQSSGGSTNLSGLLVTGSVNLSSSTFTCTSCLDGGGNINWNIIPPFHHGRSLVVSVATSTATSTIATTTEATSTTATSTATTTVVVSTTTTPVTPTTPTTPTTKTRGRVVVTATSTSPAPVDQTIPFNGGLPSSVTVATTTTSTSTTTASLSATAPVTTDTTPAATATDVVSNITNSITQSYQQTVAAPAVQAVVAAVNTQVGSAVTKTISTAGAVAGASVAISSVAFANPIAFTDLWLIPTRLFGLLVGALGIRRKNRPWGTVYDSVTKRPIDPAYVSLIDIATGKEVASAVTDFDGRYGFVAMPGTYKIVAQKTNYNLSEKLKGKAFDEVYNDLYFGDTIVVAQEGEVITKNIPMDPQGFDWNEFTKEKMQVNTFVKGTTVTWAKVSSLSFWVGSFIALLGVIISPRPYNFIIAVLYVVIYLLNYFVFKSKKTGSLTEKNTRIPLSFAIVKIFREGETEPMMKRIADKFGQYYALVPQGRYSLEIDKKNDDQSYTQVLKTEPFEVKRGVVNADLAI